MIKAAVLNRNGEKGEIEMVQKPDLTPGLGEVLIKNTAVGISRLDSITRKQLLKGALSKDEIILGYEGVGTVMEVGKDVSGIKASDKVAYFSPSACACASHCVVNHINVVAIPDGMREKTVAGIFLSGMLAHALAVRALGVSKKTKVLVHEVDLAVGRIIAQFIKTKEPSILIGSVSSDENINISGISDICGHVLNYNSETFISDVMKLTEKEGVNVVYDGVGSEYILKRSMRVLDDFGLLALYNSSIFAIPHLPIVDIAKKSLFVTALTVFKYKSVREEILLAAHEIFSMIGAGTLSVETSEYHISKLQTALDSVENSAHSVIVTF